MTTTPAQTSETPQVDAVIRRHDGGDEPNSFDYVDPDDARQLEKELTASQASLAAERKKLEDLHRHHDALKAGYSKAHEMLDAAMARIAELEKDAARYRWLHQFDSWSWSKPPMRAITFSWSIRCSKEEIDQVIDAALPAKD